MYKRQVTSTAAGSASQFLEQISGLLVIWMGATLVLKGQLTLGQLIAFRILSGYVTSPLLRLASLWQNFQAVSYTHLTLPTMPTNSPGLISKLTFSSCSGPLLAKRKLTPS